MSRLILLSLLAFYTLLFPLYVSAYQCDLLGSFSEAVYCGDPIEIEMSFDNIDETCFVDPLECSWTSPEGPLVGNIISANMPGIYTATVTDCAGCIATKQVNIVDEALNGGNLINGVSLTMCTGDGVDDIILDGSLAIQNASGPITQLLIVDYSGQILFMPQSISEINWDVLGEGQLLIVNLAHGEDLEGLVIGANIWSDLLGCNDKSNPLYVNLENCLGPGPGLPEVIPLNATETSISLYWDDDFADPSEVTFQYKESSSSNWLSISPNDNFIILNNLLSCTSYSFRLEADDAGTLVYSSISYIETAGCAVCPTIQNLFGFNYSNNSAFLTWDVIIDASYVFHYKGVNDLNWVSYETDFPVVVLFGLSDCSIYEWYVEADCINVEDLSSSAIETMQTTCKGDITANSDIFLSPNPTTGDVQLFSAKSIDYIEVIDYRGRVYHSERLDFKSGQTLNLNHLESGAYFIKASGHSGHNSLQSFIKQ